MGEVRQGGNNHKTRRNRCGNELGGCKIHTSARLATEKVSCGSALASLNSKSEFSILWRAPLTLKSRENFAGRRRCGLGLAVCEQGKRVRKVQLPY